MGVRGDTRSIVLGVARGSLGGTARTAAQMRARDRGAAQAVVRDVQMMRMRVEQVLAREAAPDSGRGGTRHGWVVARHEQRTQARAVERDERLAEPRVVHRADVRGARGLARSFRKKRNKRQESRNKLLAARFGALDSEWDTGPKSSW